jgi:hypothetical protein
MSEYPIKKHDSLNRLIYVDWNGVERLINIYWGDTNKVKIKYRLWNDDAEVEAYDKNGNQVFNSSSGVAVFKFPRLRIEKGRVSYIVDKKKIKEWVLKLECIKKK